MHHVGVVVEDLPAAVEFFVDLGLELEGEESLEDRAVDRVLGLDGVRTDVAFLRTPDGHGALELTKFKAPMYSGVGAPAPPHAPGLRHLTFEVQDIDAVLAGLRARGYELVGELERFGGYRLCYVSGPEGIIVELGERTA